MGRTYRAICFDLDGTLLPMDLDEFLATYFKGIAAFAAGKGYDGASFLTAFGAAAKAMDGNDGSACLLNADAFWNEFLARMGGAKREWETLFNEYYATDFARIGQGVKPNPHAARAVEAFAAKGYPVLLTTQPMFPEIAVRQRLAWAGVRPEVFARITCYDNSLAVKPKLAYYAENLAACGVRGADVLMVGNNTVDDLVFAGLSADVYLATDYLLNPAGVCMDAVRHGSLEDLATWAASDALAPCSNPAMGIERGLVDAAAREAALADNVLPGVSDETPLFAGGDAVECGAEASGKAAAGHADAGDGIADAAGDGAAAASVAAKRGLGD